MGPLQAVLRAPLARRWPPLPQEAAHDTLGAVLRATQDLHAPAESAWRLPNKGKGVGAELQLVKQRVDSAVAQLENVTASLGAAASKLRNNTSTLGGSANGTATTALAAVSAGGGGGAAAAESGGSAGAGGQGGSSSEQREQQAAEGGAGAEGGPAGSERGGAASASTAAEAQQQQQQQLAGGKEQGEEHVALALDAMRNATNATLSTVKESQKALEAAHEATGKRGHKVRWAGARHPPSLYTAGTYFWDHQRRRK